jgi:hypothetical protein
VLSGLNGNCSAVSVAQSLNTNGEMEPRCTSFAFFSAVGLELLEKCPYGKNGIVALKERNRKS